MLVKLSNEREVELKFTHVQDGNARFTILDSRYKSTDLAEEYHWDFYAFCHEKDKFSREMGRKVTTSRLIFKLQNLLSKEERKEIWKKVLPKRSIL